MRLIEDVNATGSRRALRHAYIWYRFAIIVVRDMLGLPFSSPVSGKKVRVSFDCNSQRASV